jgi:hypothetical protein
MVKLRISRRYILSINNNKQMNKQMKNLFTVASIMLFTMALVMVGCVREKTDAELQE